MLKKIWEDGVNTDENCLRKCYKNCFGVQKMNTKYYKYLHIFTNQDVSRRIQSALILYYRDTIITIRDTCRDINKNTIIKRPVDCREDSQRNN
jgi:hypothetical protein